LAKEYYLYPVRVIDDAEAVIYQPVCVFNFNALYELTNYFLYLGILNLCAFFASLLL
jgi:hypothetical protein